MKRSLFVLAHPDDELLFAHAMAAQEEATVIIATNGEASSVDRIGASFVAEGRRSQESAQALGALGIRADRLHQYDLPDGALNFHYAKLGGRIARLALTEELDAIYSFDKDGFDDHPDHVATYLASQLVAKARGLPHLVRSRNPNLDYATEEVLTVTGEEETKLIVIRNHTSQWNPSDPQDIARLRDEYAGGFHQEYYLQAA